MNSITGRCLCEAIVYRIEGDLGPVFNCHCSKCRRWHGAAFRTRASIKRSQFSWLAGEHLLSRYTSSDTVTKTFCSVCGSNLASFYADLPDIVGIALGGLESDPGLRPLANIFVGSKAPWYDICDGLPQFEGWPTSESAVRATAED
ncbi:GFA family protein [Halopseudomonas nanhaiensis]|uniref:GFA family protein n=1 Tax=Halopseudomonas nanhaiensis TaxID=2830842 RepID=UPI001CC029C0|nr:GFA family protein [Halopseudomonas nanhaiensis]UAW97796.1 GFA family protein [Halopseudomonas nanhaiensis]